MKRILCLLVLFVLAPVAGAAAQEVTADRDQLMAAARLQMATTLAEGATPEAWDAALFVSVDAVSHALAQLQGTTLSFPTADNLPAAVIDVRSVTVGGQTAAVGAHLELGAHIDGVPFIDVPIPAEALFFVSGFETDPASGETSLVISPRIVKLGPDNPLIAALVELTKLIVDIGTIPELERAMTVKVPLPSGFSMSTAINETLTVPAGSGTIDFAVTSPGATLATSFRFGALITADGIWALGKTGAPTGAAPVADVDAALVPYTAPAGSVALFLSGGILGPVVSQFNALDPAMRTIDVQSTAVTGELFAEHWSDDILGDGGFIVRMSEPTSAHATISVGALSANWDSSSSAFAIALPVDVVATGHIDVHFDPFVGGGAGTSIGVNGRASFTATGTAAFRQLTDGADDGLWLVPDISCQSVPISIATDGTLEIADIGVPMPTVGANFSAEVGKKAMTPIPLLTTIPEREPLPPSLADRATTAYPNGATQVEWKFTRFSTAPSPAGLWATATVEASLVGADAPAPRDRATLVEAVAAALAQARPPCPSNDRVEILVDGLEIGSNSLLLLPYREAYKLANNIVDETGRALKRFDKEAGKVVDVIADGGEAVTSVLEGGGEIIKDGVEKGKDVVTEVFEDIGDLF